MPLFHSSQHWTDTYITRGFSPHILFPGFYNPLVDLLTTHYEDYFTNTIKTTIKPFSTITYLHYQPCPLDKNCGNRDLWNNSDVSVLILQSLIWRDITETCGLFLTWSSQLVWTRLASPWGTSGPNP